MSMSIGHGLLGNPDSFCPDRKRARFALICDFYSSPRIAGLLRAAYPYAIGFAVIAVYVLALYGQIAGARPHIGIEFSEVSPFIAYFYASAAIVLIAACFWIVAALQNASPNHVNRSPRSSVLYGAEVRATTARFAIPIAKSASLNDAFVTTDASTSPILILASFWRSLNGRVIAKLLSSNHWAFCATGQPSHLVSTSFHTYRIS